MFQDVVEKLYTWNSKPLARFQYFSISILGTMITLGLLSLISPLLDLEGSFWVFASLGLLLLAVLHNVYVSVNLVRKRLIDIGWTQEHLWWIFGLWFVTTIHSWGEPESTITYCLLGLDLIVSLWLLFTPGEKK